MTSFCVQSNLNKQKHNRTTKPGMTSVHVLGTTLINVPHNNLLITKSIMILVVHAFQHKVKQSYTFKQLEESLRDLQFPQANLHRALIASQLRNKRNKGVFLFNSACLFAYRGEYGTAGGGGMYRSKMAGFSFFSEVSMMLSGDWVEVGRGLV